MAPPLSEDDYVQFYNLRREASSMTSTSISWLSSETVNLLENAVPTPDGIFKVLSIGPGPGDIDLQFIHTLRHHISSPRLSSIWKGLHYVALEPNPTYSKGLCDSLEQVKFHFSDFTFQVHTVCFEQFHDLNHKYDTILLAHVLYYFEHLALALQRTRFLARANASVIIFHLSRTAISDIIRNVLKGSHDKEMEVLNATGVEHTLQLMSAPYRYQELSAELDVSECLKLSKVGAKIMSFCVERDLSSLTPAQLSRVAGVFREKAFEKEKKRFVLQDNVGVFVVKPMEKNLKLDCDTDAVDDYRVLSREVPWQQLFRTVLPDSKVSLRVLDVACGRGRWLSALSMYSAENFKGQTVELDVLDVSQTAVEQMVQTIKPPFTLHSSFVSKVQDVDLDRSSYDIIWSMHGLYAVAADELPTVLSSMNLALRQNGVCVIALATRKSFYVAMPNEYSKAVKEIDADSEEHRITSAEDVIEALRNLDIAFKVRSMVYEQRIDAVNEAECISYVVDESMFNSFNADESETLEHFAQTDSLPQRQSAESIMQAPAVQQYIGHFLRGGAYHFGQEIQMISFGHPSVLESLPAQAGVYIK
ncbi:unnamed protein product [Agarophyton chilense]